MLCDPPEILQIPSAIFLFNRLEPTGSEFVAALQSQAFTLGGIFKAQRFRRNVRSYATVPKRPKASRSSGGPVDLPPLTSPPPLTTPSEVVVWVAYGAAFHAFLEWSDFLGSNLYRSWKAESQLQTMLKELDRKKEESPEAYLEMLSREIMSLRQPDPDRNKLAEWEVKNYERKIAVLESNLHAWFAPILLESKLRAWIKEDDLKG